MGLDLPRFACFITERAVSALRERSRRSIGRYGAPDEVTPDMGAERMTFPKRLPLVRRPLVPFLRGAS